MPKQSEWYKAKNATDLLQVVNFIGLLQLVNQLLQQVCQFQTKLINFPCVFIRIIYRASLAHSELSN